MGKFDLDRILRDLGADSVPEDDVGPTKGKGAREVGGGDDDDGRRTGRPGEGGSAGFSTGRSKMQRVLDETVPTGCTGVMDDDDDERDCRVMTFPSGWILRSAECTTLRRTLGWS